MCVLVRRVLWDESIGEGDVCGGSSRKVVAVVAKAKRPPPPSPSPVPPSPPSPDPPPGHNPIVVKDFGLLLGVAGADVGGCRWRRPLPASSTTIIAAAKSREVMIV